MIQRFGHEILMDREIQPVIAFICYMKLAEGDIANGNIKKVIREGSLLIALHRNTAFLIKLAGDAAREIVQLHAVQLAAAHAFRQHTEEITDATGRFQNVALLETHLPQCGVDTADDHRRRVERCERGFTGSGILGVGEQVFQLSISRVLFLKKAGKAAPTDILRQHRLFFCGGGAILGLYGFQRADRIQIVLKALQRRALSDMVIGDAVISAICVQRVGNRVPFSLFRRCENHTRLVCLCRCLLHVGLFHMLAYKFYGFLSKNGEPRPVFKGHIPQRDTLRMIVYAVHFKLPPIYGQACACGNRCGYFRLHSRCGFLQHRFRSRRIFNRVDLP